MLYSGRDGVFLVPANGNNETSLQNPAYHNDIKPRINPITRICHYSGKWVLNAPNSHMPL